jgi:dTDP-4-dehydrorhamnose 3,5-epimerase-like enzyme
MKFTKTTLFGVWLIDLELRSDERGFLARTYCEVFYQMSEIYVPELARGLRWNDPQVGVKWPIPQPAVSKRDQALPLLAELR